MNIAAVSTPYGTGGIAVIRISGPDAIEIVSKIWKGANLKKSPSHTMHYGEIVDFQGETIDQGVASIYHAPNSYTGENTVELSVHGSKWIQRKVLDILAEAGARPAEGGEFTKRAFLNGKLDLAQAEGVADMIAASSAAAHRMAMSQLNGSFSKGLDTLREKLINLAALLELELDFSEEDVEFADRKNLMELTQELKQVMNRLVKSYDAGKAFKEGIPVAIAGSPNAGKSTLLNALLGEEKAIVTDIPGTTRDLIDDTLEMGGILFRFYDTAGLRETSDKVEKIGIDRAREIIDRSMVTVWLIDPMNEIQPQINELKAQHNAHMDSKTIICINKTDALEIKEKDTRAAHKEKESAKDLDIERRDAGDVSIEKRDAGDVRIEDIKDLLRKSGLDTYKEIEISAKGGKGLEELKREIIEASKSEYDPQGEMILSNARHKAAVEKAIKSLNRVSEGLETGISADFIAQDVREVITHVAEITGAITTPTLLTQIFSTFCIGK